MTTHRRIVHDTEGLNSGEWPLDAVEHFVTPVPQFFTRSHAPAPPIDPAGWRLVVDGLVERPVEWTLGELLSRYPERTVPATLVCAGLRRDELLSVAPLPDELPWGPEPVSTGEWSGISLSDVLRTVGVRAGTRHVEFTGLDRVEREGKVFGFGGSIDLDKAMSGEVLLATKLNGAPLTPIHGYPLRTIVPGWIGARSVKWLGRITLRDTPSENYFQSQAYRVQHVADSRRPRDVSAGTPMRGVPLNAIIAQPVKAQEVRAGPVVVRGWAMGSEGRPLTAIEVSADGGASWERARITRKAERWTWTLWEATLDLAPGSHLLVSRASDTSPAMQPASLRQAWNVKGYGNNAWHRVPVTAV